MYLPMVSWKIQRLTEANCWIQLMIVRSASAPFRPVKIFEKKNHQFRGNILQHCNKIVFQLKFQSMKINWHFGMGNIVVRVFISLDFVNMALGWQLFGILFVFSVRILIG